jgi:CelD/BcsL family acetyltransferase involved in cellulose biosynthesis
MENEIQATGNGVLMYGMAAASSVPVSGMRNANLIEERVGHGLAELLSLEDHWRALAMNSVRHRFIHTFEWQLAYLKHLESHPDSTYYFSFFSNGRAVAIFPLRRVRRSVGHISHWLWELPTHPHLILSEPLIAPEWADSDLIQRLIKALDRCPNLRWDALHLPNLLEDSLAIRVLQTNSLPRTHLEETGQSMFFPCGDLNQAVANCSGPFKRNLRRQAKRLAQQGAVSFCLVGQGAELDAAFADFLRLEASGWKGGKGKGSAISLHAHLLGFYGELKERFSRCGGCLISLLKLNGVAIAAQFCLFVDGIVYVQKIAYDEAWHTEAPGNQLLHRMLEYCCAEPSIRQLSLVTAPSWAFGRWNPGQLKVWEAYVFRASPRGLGGLVMRRFKHRLGAPAQNFWERTCSVLQATSDQ